MSPIRQLSPSVVNKIAAGEVIERPASVVKELMENSIDAGATRIDVTASQGGVDLIRLADNGCGIEAEQLPLAVASHATSKICAAEDLFHVGTLGFRGEALASIGEVSRLLVRSRTAQAAAGAQVELVGGVLGGPVPCAAPPGTTIEVRDLFFNTPVRRKFLRSAQTEMGYVSETFVRLALAYPGIHFTLRRQDQVVHDLPPVDDARRRIANFFGDELAADLIAVASEEEDVSLGGYVASPAHNRGNARMQYLFLNGRAIRDRALQHALAEAYRGLLMTGRYPIAFLTLRMPPEKVDVNVHPAKLEVRFQESGRLYSQLLGTLRTKFLSTDLTARLQPASESPWSAAHDRSAAGEIRQDLVDWAKERLESSGSIIPAPDDQRQFGWEESRRRQAPLTLNRLDRPWPSFDAAQEQDQEYAPGTGSGDAVSVPRPSAIGSHQVPSPAVQIHNRYLVAETEEGMAIIDQHALHERILYEQIRTKVLEGTAETQSLLVPEPVDLAPAEAAAVLDARGVLSQLGLTVEPFGGDTVLITAYPAMLANLSPAEILRTLVDRLLAGGKAPDRRDLVDELLHTIACKAAVKAGDRLTGEEISALLQQRHLVHDAHHCPHGRPTALVFTREELDKQFKRI